jgi:hypothetical protein
MEQNHVGGDRSRDGFMCIVASSHSELAGGDIGLLAFTTGNTKALRSPCRYLRLPLRGMSIERLTERFGNVDISPKTG